MNIGKRIAAICIALFAFVLPACANADKPAENRIAVEGAGILHEEKFGGVYITLTIDEFNERGFAYGDSVNIEFSNGFVLTDIPYYNGFYVDMGEPLLVAYPGYPYIRAGYNNGDDMYAVARLDKDDTASIRLNEKAKYLDEQNAMDIHYSDEQGEKSDEVFANFRAVNAGDLKENTLYRSASPCDNQHKRAAVSDRLAMGAGINFMLNLSDDENELREHIEGEDFDSPHFLSLYNAGKVAPLSLSMAYKSETFSQKLAAGLRALSACEGPFLVHCVEGKDRTGFVCAVIEALAGATYDEIVDDYMITYYNYYGIDKRSDPVKYRIIKEKNIDVMLEFIAGDNGADITNADYSVCADSYLTGIGLTREEVNALKARFVKPNRSD